MEGKYEDHRLVPFYVILYLITSSSLLASRLKVWYKVLQNRPTFPLANHQPPVYPTFPANNLSENQLEDIVENEIASSSIWHKLENLAVVHRSLLLIDLKDFRQRLI